MTEMAFTSIQFISSGDEYYDFIVREINKAQVEVHIECYIFNFDSIGKKILQVLAEAVKRKVTTRLLIDGIGSYSQISQIHSFCSEHGIEFRVYRPVPYLIFVVRHLPGFIKKVNQRNHRKLIIIDKKKAFIASFNISKVHSESESGANAWKDLAVYVEGPEVLKIWTLLSVHWSRLPFTLIKLFPRISFTRVRSTHSISARRIARKQLLGKILNSKEQIKILTPYFVPSKKIIRSLIKASKNHNNIEIIIPIRSDFIVVDLAGRYVLRTLLKHKVKVHQYLPCFMHAKALIVDQWATLGSHNLNHRSLIHDLELDITLEGPSEIFPLEQYWQELKSSSKLISEQELANDSLLIRMLCRLAFWFKNWL